MSFCTPTKKTVKIPKVNHNQKWFTKKSLKKYSDEFSKKDWSRKDTTSTYFLDSLTKAVWNEN